MITMYGGYSVTKRIGTAGVLALISSLFCLQPADAQNRPEWCEPDKRPEINIKPKSDKVKYNFSKSIDQINRKNIDTKNPYSDNVITKAGGLMSGGIETRHRFEIGTKERTYKKQVCAWYDKITVRIKIEPTIFVAREFGKNSCPRRAILEHEQKHIRVDREIVQKYARKFGRAIKNYIDNNHVYGPVPSDGFKNMQKRMTDQINWVISRVGRRMERERQRRQQAVDTRKEYERVRNQCPASQWPDEFGNRG